MGEAIKEVVEEVEPDLAERVVEFNEGLKKLLKKCEMYLSAQPQILPDGRLSAGIIIGSDRKKEEEVEKQKLAEA